MNDRGHLSSETIDLLMLSSLAAGDAAKAREHIAGCDKCKARWSELEEDKARFEQFVFPRTVAKIEARARRSWLDLLRQRWSILVPVIGVAVAATLVVVANKKQTEDEPYLGIKGVPSVEVYATHDGQHSFKVENGAKLRPNDRLEFRVTASGQVSYLLIVSKDGAGNDNVYYPFDGKQSAHVNPGTSNLPSAIQLDDVLGHERMVAIFSEKPIDADTAKKALAGNPPDVAGAKVQVLEFDKVAQ